MKTILSVLVFTSLSIACNPHSAALKRVKEEAAIRKAEKILTAGGGGKKNGIHVYTFLMILPKKENMVATIQVDEAKCEIISDAFIKPWEAE